MKAPLSGIQMDVMTIACVAVAGGAMAPALLPVAVRAAQYLDDDWLLPSQVVGRLEALGVEAHVEVFPGRDLIQSYAACCRRYQWALVQLISDHAHEYNWWSILHICDDGNPAVTALLSGDPDECGCLRLPVLWTGLAVILDRVPDASVLGWAQPIAT